MNFFLFYGRPRFNTFKISLFCNRDIRPGEDNDEEEEARLKNKRLRDDPMARIPREFRSLESRNNKSIIKREDVRDDDEDCKIVEKKSTSKKKKSKKDKKSKKKKRKKSKKYESSSTSESSSEDECAKAAMLVELRRKRLLREQKERVKADELRNRHKGLFKH